MVAKPWLPMAFATKKYFHSQKVVDIVLSCPEQIDCVWTILNPGTQNALRIYGDQPEYLHSFNSLNAMHPGIVHH